MTERRIRTTINANLVRRMQAGVAGQTAPTTTPSAQELVRPETPENEPKGAGEGRLRPISNFATTSGTGGKKRQSRTTFSVPTAVGEQLRRLTYALTLLDGMESSVGTTVSRALDLLEEDIKSSGLDLPEGGVKLRSGPRLR